MVDINDRDRFQYYSKISGREIEHLVTPAMCRRWANDNSIYVIEQTNDCSIRYELAAFVKKYL